MNHRDCFVLTSVGDCGNPHQTGDLDKRTRRRKHSMQSPILLGAGFGGLQKGPTAAKENKGNKRRAH